MHSRITCFFPRWVKITVFFMRARALYRHQTLFPLVRSQDFSPQKMRQNLHVFPRFIPAAHRRMTLGLHVFPRLTRCMFFCAQQQLHVFPQPRYELERTLGTRLIPPLRMTCKITFNYLFADGHAMPDTIVSVIARPS